MSKCVKLDSLNWEQVRSGVCRKVVHGEGGTISLNKLAAGHEPKPHQHAHEQIAIILKGRTKFTVGDTVYELQENDIVVIPPNVVHFAEVIGDEDCYNLDVFVPRRGDYVETALGSEK